MRLASFFLCLVFAASGGAAAAPADSLLAASVAGPARSAASVARDPFRHPADELAFFGVRPDMTVVEIWPGGGYWTEILGPYLHDHGTYAVALPPREAGPYAAKGDDAVLAKLAADKAAYGNVRTVFFGKDTYDLAPPSSVDLIVTFRNLHNWIEGGYADAALAAFYKALKPGGILGIEDHRARTDRPQDPAAKDGYVRQDYAIALAEKAGFKLVAASEINANPKDTKDWPKGVWTLPPTFALGDQDRAKYAAIGEADNFVLKFQKPSK